MTNIVDTLRECHEIVWRYRRELEPYWPTPTTEDALLFAFTELGEAVDAHLRSNPQYARNRDKDLSVLDELADCAMMLLTAMGRDFVLVYGLPEHQREWAGYAHFMSQLLVDTEADRLDYGDIAYLVMCIANHPGMDLPARLAARLERIKAKRWREKGLAQKDNDAYANALLRHAGEMR